jgi:hypothetical protein
MVCYNIITRPLFLQFIENHLQKKRKVDLI